MFSKVLSRNLNPYDIINNQQQQIPDMSADNRAPGVAVPCQVGYIQGTRYGGRGRWSSKTSDKVLSHKWLS